MLKITVSRRWKQREYCDVKIDYSLTEQKKKNNSRQKQM